jgi:hypothetical protein
MEHSTTNRIQTQRFNKHKIYVKNLVILSLNLLNTGSVFTFKHRLQDFFLECIYYFCFELT